MGIGCGSKDKIIVDDNRDIDEFSSCDGRRETNEKRVEML
jgi:hypothetical protein